MPSVCFELIREQGRKGQLLIQERESALALAHQPTSAEVGKDRELLLLQGDACI
jgi:hypothetical protein